MIPKYVFPQFVKHLPVYQGYPIPVIQYVGLDGTPDFKVIDEEKRFNVIHNRLCGVCGFRLNPVIAFIGGEKSCKSGLFTTPAMHSECARFAAVTCPYLTGERRQYSQADPKHLGEGLIVHNLSISPHPPKRMGIYYTKSYQLSFQDAAMILKAGPPTSIDWDIMPEIIITE